MSPAIPFAVGLATFAVYASVVFDDVPGGDAGELLAEACALGVAHPPGYPLLTALSGMLFGATGVTALPALGGDPDSFQHHGDDGWNPARVGNTLAAALSAGAAALMFAASRHIVWMDHQAGGGGGGGGGTGSSGGGGGARGLGFLPTAAACLATGFFAFAPLTMLYAASAEVFALNNFLCALVVWAFACYHAQQRQHRSEPGATVQGGGRRGRRTTGRSNDDNGSGRQFRFACIGAFACGLALCNQHTSVLTVAPLAAVVAVDVARRRGGLLSAHAARSLVMLGLCGLCGLAPYAYLPLSARGWFAPVLAASGAAAEASEFARTVGSWGNAGTWDGFWAHFLRAEYGSLALSPVTSPSSTFWTRLRAYFADLIGQHLLVGSMLALGGVVCTVFQQWRLCRSAARLRRAAQPRKVGNALLQKQPPPQKKAAPIAETKKRGAATGGSKSGGGLRRRGSQRKHGASNNNGDDDNATIGASRAPDAVVTAAADPVASAVDTGAVILAAWVLYVIVFHALANLPIESSAMARGVFARFWLQPNLLLCPLIARGVVVLTVPLSRATATVRARSARRQQGTAAAAPARACSSSSSVVRYPQRLSHQAQVVDTASAAAAAAPGGSCGGRGGSRVRAVFVAVCFAVTAFLALRRREQLLAPGGGAAAVGGGSDDSDVNGTPVTVGHFGRALLASLPPHSLLLSHTDLNWNAVRYLQACEGLRPDVVHLSLQLLPYPWFSAAGGQKAAYERRGVRFAAELPARPSTDVATPENAQLIVQLAAANLLNTAGGAYRNVFVDLHGVNPADLGADNSYFGLRLVPWGVVWKMELPSRQQHQQQQDTLPGGGGGGKDAGYSEFLRRWLADVAGHEAYNELAAAAVAGGDGAAADGESRLRRWQQGNNGRGRDPAKLARMFAGRRYGFQAAVLDGPFRDVVHGSLCHRSRAQLQQQHEWQRRKQDARLGRAASADPVPVAPAEVSACFYEPGAPGTWEHAALQVTRDSMYQRALFMLAQARHLSAGGGGAKDSSDDHSGDGDVATALLREAVEALDLLWWATYAEGRTTSFSRRDFVKNRALAHAQLNMPVMRARFVAAAAAAAGSGAAAWSPAEERMLHALRVYVQEAEADDNRGDDPDVPKFQRILGQYDEAGSAGGGGGGE